MIDPIDSLVSRHKSVRPNSDDDEELDDDDD